MMRVGVITNIAESVRTGGSLGGDSGSGQPQAYTSLFKLKYVYLISHYTHCTTSTELPLCSQLEWRTVATYKHRSGFTLRHTFTEKWSHKI